ncbi:hypothetical protein PFDG_04588 [Plasmodium falciparum Dd2]|uniref:AAA+ ATPase domain-containing protein n=1 Tax=Plasmodium falciparum (isolate Dd2) TaxID=57267 RepID=A0A0L7M8K8_PLAF4|nr:hypothetical protein PFDG_04588 [Plasmodium falciparum Dd2]
MVRELFQMAKSKKACILFIDEVDAIGGSRGDESAHGDHEVQRTMLEIVNQLDGFDNRGNIKVLMATNRPDTLDSALDRLKLAHIYPNTCYYYDVCRDVRFELLARLCPHSTGSDIRSVCTEAGMFAIRARRKPITEKDLLFQIIRLYMDVNTSQQQENMWYPVSLIIFFFGI